jgi:hypothetical protein
MERPFFFYWMPGLKIKNPTAPLPAAREVLAF